MFDIGFSEILLIFIIALVVLGPEKLPRLASQVGRWVGRARAMARQFREQLEEEVNLEDVRKAQEARKAADSATQSETQQESGTETASASASAGTASDGAPATAAAPQATNSAMIGPDPVDFRADTFSHAHATNEYGANPYTPNGAAEPPEDPSSLAPWPSVRERSHTTDSDVTSPSEASAAAATRVPDTEPSQPGNAGIDPHRQS